MVYLDNAATTPVSKDVVNAMSTVLLETHGNPSSIHQFGRKAKIQVENVRKKIAKNLRCQPGEIFFTAGGTEADNLAIQTSVRDLGVTRIITSKIEHHAVLNPIEFLEKQGKITVEYVDLTSSGEVVLDSLHQLLHSEEKTLVSLMYANNEIGNLLDIKKIANLCKEYNALFHSDMVQAFGHYNINLEEVPVDFMASSAHKYHGPKGVGFCFIRGGLKLSPWLHGGGQERNMRAGTENVHSIVGMGVAIDQAYDNLDTDRKYIESLKSYFVKEVSELSAEIGFNGLSADIDKSLFTVVSLKLPKNSKTEMILFQLDMAGFAVSGGSACNSGSQKASHVIEALRGEEEQIVVRVSFSKYNSKEEVDSLLETLKRLIE